MHIPKTAVTAFMSTVGRQVPREELKIWNEDCLQGTRYQKVFPEENNYHATFLREPRHHILSQYFQCDNGWENIGSENKNFPRAMPIGALVNLLKEKETLERKIKSLGEDASMRAQTQVELDNLQRKIDLGYQATMKNLDKWLDHFDSSWTQSKGYYGCYHPKSMQTRAFVCHGSWDRLHSIFERQLLMPDVDLSIKRMKKTWFVGISEYFHESVCMWEYQYHHTLPRYCDCDSGVKRPEPPHELHGVPPHSLSDVTQAQMRKLDSFIFEDSQLYGAAIEEFKARLRYLELVTGKKVYCKKDGFLDS